MIFLQHFYLLAVSSKLSRAYDSVINVKLLLIVLLSLTCVMSNGQMLLKMFLL